MTTNYTLPDEWESEKEEIGVEKDLDKDLDKDLLNDYTYDKKLLGVGCVSEGGGKRAVLTIDGVSGRYFLPDGAKWGTFEADNGTSLTVHISEVRYV